MMEKQNGEIRIREAVPEDAGAVLGLIRELAEYEKAPQEVELTEEQWVADGFGPEPHFYCFVAENEYGIIGFALCYFRYSTWKGLTLYLEDLYVKEAYRKTGIGKKLFETARSFGVHKQCRNLQWQVLDWNEPAITFYRKLGAELDPSWINGRISLKNETGRI